MDRPRQPRDVATAETVRFVRKHVVPGRRLLEIGCGTGEVAAELAQTDQVVALDSAPDSVAQARRLGIDARVADWPFEWKEAPFDAVLFTRSLHHLEALDAGLLGARGVLAPDGVVLVEDFAYSEANGSVRRWMAERARELQSRALITPPADSLVARLLASDDPERAWDDDHEHAHELHSATAMETALRSHFSTVHLECSPYLYRYFVEALPQDGHGAQLMSTLLEQERALGDRTAIGRRWVARS